MTTPSQIQINKSTDLISSCSWTTREPDVGILELIFEIEASLAYSASPEDSQCTS